MSQAGCARLVDLLLEREKLRLEIAAQERLLQAHAERLRLQRERVELLTAAIAAAAPGVGDGELLRTLAAVNSLAASEGTGEGEPGRAALGGVAAALECILLASPVTGRVV